MKFKEFIDKTDFTVYLLKNDCDNMIARLDAIINELGNRKIVVSVSNYSSDVITKEDLIEMKRRLLFLSNGANLIEVNDNDNSGYHL